MTTEERLAYALATLAAIVQSQGSTGIQTNMAANALKFIKEKQSA